VARKQFSNFLFSKLLSTSCHRIFVLLVVAGFHRVFTTQIVNKTKLNTAILLVPP